MFKNQAIIWVVLALLLVGGPVAYYTAKPMVQNALGGGTGTIDTLDQFTGSTSPNVAITQRTFGKLLRLSGPTYSGLGCLGTDADGTVGAGTCTGGGGGSSFSTTSADYWKSVRNFFSTTSANYWSTLGLGFSTTSADFWLTTKSVSGFSTTSADYWKSVNNFFSTTSADYLASQRNFFSTTSASFFSSAGLAFSTTSTDYWKTQNNFFSTTSASFFSSAGLAFSTTSANYYTSVTNFFSTTSANYWSSLGFGWATSSATAWSAAGLGFSTTSANFWGTTGSGFSTTSASYFFRIGLAFSTTTTNVFTALNTFGAGLISQGSTTIVGNATTTGSFYSGIATSSQTYGSGLSNCVGGTNALNWTAATGLFSCLSISASGSVGNWFTPVPLFGATVANATSTLIGFTNGIYALATSTIGSGAQTGGLTVSGGATTTGIAYFGSSVGIGSTSPYALLGINAPGGAAPLLAIGSSTSEVMSVYSANHAQLSIGSTTPWAQLSVNPTGLNLTSPSFAIGSTTGTQFVVLNNGNTGVATATPGSLFAVGGALNVTTATSTFVGSGGVNLIAGCFSFQGTCLQTFIQNATAYKAAANYATAAVLAGTPTYSNGASGVGATLTEVGFGALAVDGASPTLGQRILVKNQADQTQNGVYTVTTVGSGIASYVLTRATDFNTSNDVYAGVTVPVLSGGTANGDTSWVETTTGTITIGTSNIAFIESSLGANLAAHTTNASLTGTSYNGTVAVSDWGINLANSNIFSVGQIIQASSTIFQLTAIGATSTNATTTTLYASSGATILGSSTFAGNATTSGTFFANNASSTKTFGANLSQCNGASQALTWNAGLFGCNTITAGSSFPFTNITFGSGVAAAGTSTVLFPAQLAAGSSTVGTIVATSSFTNLSVTGALVLAGASGLQGAYAGSAPCTNQVALSISATGVITCTSVTNAMLSNSTLTLTDANSTLTIGGSPAALGSGFTATLNLAHANTWSVGQMIIGSSTIGAGGQATGLTISGGATTTGNMSILSSLVIGTSTGALGAVNANSGNLFLYNTNTAGASPALVMGGNNGGDTDFWFGRQNNNDSANNDSLQIGAGLVPGTTPVMTWNYQGREGISSSSPYAKLSVQANPNDLAVSNTLFAIGSSTASATTTLFSVDNTGGTFVGGRFGINDATPDWSGEIVGSNGNGYFGITNSADGDILNITSGGLFGFASTTPGTLFSIGTNNGINFTAATSTFNSTGGINITAGCFAIRGSCISGGGGGGTVTQVNTDSTLTGGGFTTSGTLGLNLSTSNIWSTGVIFQGTSTIGAGGLTTGLTINGGATTTNTHYFGTNIGIGSTTPAALFSVNVNNTTIPAFLFGSSTATLLGMNSVGGIFLSATSTATSTSMKLDWNNTPQQVEYKIGNANVTIQVINATTSMWYGSVKRLEICNPNQTSGTVTFTGVEWYGATYVHVTTAGFCDQVILNVTMATSTTGTFKVAGGANTGLQ